MENTSPNQTGSNPGFINNDTLGTTPRPVQPTPTVTVNPTLVQSAPAATINPIQTPLQNVPPHTEQASWQNPNPTTNTGANPYQHSSAAPMMSTPNAGQIALMQQTIKGWSFAGSFVILPTLIAGKQYFLAALLLIGSFIPFLNFLFWIIFFLYWGFNGKRIIYMSNRFRSHDEKLGAIRGMEIVGIVFFAFFVIGLLSFFTIGAALIGFITNLASH